MFNEVYLEYSHLALLGIFADELVQACSGLPIQPKSRNFDN